MEKEHNYSAPMPPSFNTSLDYSLDHQQHQGMGDHMRHNPHQQEQISSGFYYTGSTCFDKLNFADFGPKLGLNKIKTTAEEPGIDPVYFLKFPVLNDKMEYQNLMVSSQAGGGEAENDERFKGMTVGDESPVGGGEGVRDQDEEALDSGYNNTVELRFLGEELQKNPIKENKNKRKRPRIIKTSEEVESQRMIHIAVERNRRKQMNEHLRVLTSLTPGSYVQRGDQASIIGGAIEFVKELEQLLQCLESQKRRRILGEAGHSIAQVEDSSLQIQQPPFFPTMPLPNDQMLESGLDEETAESKSCLADVQVKLLGFDAMIKILSTRRPGQLIKTIAALEDLQLIILHTNITTVEQTVLYSFNVKVASDSSFTAEDIASSVQQIFSFIHANTGM